LARHKITMFTSVLLLYYFYIIIFHPCQFTFALQSPTEICRRWWNLP